MYKKGNIPYNKIDYNEGQFINGIKFLKELKKIKNKNSEYRAGLFVCNYCENIFKCRIDYIRDGHTKSCGCQKGQVKHNLYKSRIYGIWQGMIGRCYNENNTNFKNYGSRGIIVCDKWKNDFLNFYNWAINNNYNDKLTIDRINVYGNYEPNNCRFTTKTIQARNRRQINNTPLGIDFIKKLNKYRCRIKIERKEKHIGVFDTIKEALLARKRFVKINKLEGFYREEELI